MTGERGPPPWDTPALVVAVAFAAGVQLVVLLQSLAGADYFGRDLELKSASLAVLAGGSYLLLTGQRLRYVDGKLVLVPVAGSDAPPGSAAAPRPPPAAPQVAAPPLPQGARPPRRRVELVLETPLARGPVWPPGEPMPVTVQVRASEGGALDGLDVELELQHAGGHERAHVPLRGSAAVVSQTIPSPGPFRILARALQGGEVVAEAQVEGRAASYREEIGRRFEALKAQAARSGLAVGPDATAREVRDALARRAPHQRASLDELLAALEVALYAQEEAGRETYERLVRALREVESRSLEATPRA